MSTERDKLAEIIQDCGEYIPGSHADDYVSPDKAADAILAAGYRKPRTVTTAAELDALPAGSILLDGRRAPIRKEADGLWYWGEIPLTTELILPCNPYGLTVLHEGGAA